MSKGAWHLSARASANAKEFHQCRTYGACVDGVELMLAGDMSKDDFEVRVYLVRLQRKAVAQLHLLPHLFLQCYQKVNAKTFGISSSQKGNRDSPPEPICEVG